MADDYEYDEFNNSMREGGGGGGGGSNRYGGYDYEDEEFSSPGPRRSNQEEEEEEQHQHLHNRNNNNEDEDDEQQQQKLNGKIDSLMAKVDQLENELFLEKQLKHEIQQKYTAELDIAYKQIEEERNKALELEEQSKKGGNNNNNENNESEQIKTLQNELKKWKNKCDNLQDKLDIALITNPSGSNSVAGSVNGGGKENGVSSQIQEELLRYCHKYSLFPELQDKLTLSNADAMKIFQSIHAQLRKKAKETSSSSSSSRMKTESKTMEEDDNKQEHMNSYHQHHRLNDKIKILEEELKLAANHADDITHLKNRVLQLSERIRVEKEYKKNFESECYTLKKKVDMLSDHIEKLVLHIKREGAAKVKFAEQTRILEKDNMKLREKYDGIYRKVAIKDRLIYELREGSRVLEDQLKLMDEKYLELRNKLDYARYVSGKKIKKAEKTASELRVKYAMLGSVVPLDSLPMPSSSSMSYHSGNYDGMSVGTFSHDGHSESFRPLTNGGTSAPPSAFVKHPTMRRGLSKLHLNTDMSVTGGVDGVPTMTTATTFNTAKSSISLDDVLEKIRVQHQGSKNDWTEDKVRKLVAKH